MLCVDLFVRGRAFSAPVVVLPHQEAEVVPGLDIIAHLDFRLFIGPDTPQHRTRRNQRRRQQQRLRWREFDEGLGVSEPEGGVGY